MIQDPRYNPDPLQKLIDLSLVRVHSSLKISSKSVHNFLNFAHGHTDRYENITSLVEVIVKNKLAAIVERRFIVNLILCGIVHSTNYYRRYRYIQNSHSYKSVEKLNCVRTAYCNHAWSGARWTKKHHYFLNRVRYASDHLSPYDTALFGTIQKTAEKGEAKS